MENTMYLQLREQTKRAHQSLEKVIVQHIKQVNSVNDYLKLLKLFYSFYYPVESRLNQYLNDDNLPSYSSRRKANDLLKDIASFDASYTNTTLCTDIPVVESYTDAVAAMYVLEGSTLGGVIIAGMLEKQTGLPQENMLFFRGYGQKANDKWNEFIAAIDGVEVNELQRQRMVEIARETFQKFEAWANIFMG